jgi:hypothetical protein
MGRDSAHDYIYVCASDKATGQCVVAQAAPNQPQDAVVPLMYPVRWPGKNPGYIHGTDSSGISCEQEIRKRPTLSRVAAERLQRPSPWFRPRRRLTRNWLAQSGSFADIVVS